MRALGIAIRRRSAMDPILASAIFNNRPSLVERLVARSPGKVFSRAIDGRSPLMSAAWLGRDKIVKMLAPLSNPNAVDRRGDSALALAAAGLSSACFEALLPHSNLALSCRLGRSPLMMAAEIGSKDGCEWLLAFHGRAQAQLADLHGSTPLMRAAEFGHLDCLEALAPHSLLFAVNAARQSALTLAAISGHVSCVQFLLSAASASLPGSEAVAENIAGRLLSAARGQAQTADEIARLSTCFDEAIILRGIAAESSLGRQFSGRL